MANASGARGFDAGFGDGAPPPSTLAAQLVEDISPSTKSSRSDENAELKGHFATIQRVKDNPDLLSTLSERVEHNHMLIYVYSRAVLENIKLDDPFLDRTHTRAEVLKAVNFLRFTIKETPSVLSFCTGGEGFLFRGQEPLWTWLLPQLLRMLGHPHCLDLQGSLEGFLQYLLLVTARSESLREVAPALGLYLRGCLTGEFPRQLSSSNKLLMAQGLLDHIQDALVVPSNKDVTTQITLPPSLALGQILGTNWFHTTRDTSYNISRAFHALRQASSLANVLAYPLISTDPAFNSILPWSENTSWLLDALMDLRLVQKRWEASSLSKPIFIVDLIQDILTGVSNSEEAALFPRDKAYTLLILVCSDLIASPGELVLIDASGDGARLSYCKALVAITQASLQNKTIARLAESRLVNELALLSSQYPAVGENTDVWVSWFPEEATSG